MSKVFEAKYDGWCPACWERIKAGESVTYGSLGPDDDALTHEDCYAEQGTSAEVRMTEVCAKCFIQKPCPCEDGQ